jgi:hypothetical protein
LAIAGSGSGREGKGKSAFAEHAHTLPDDHPFIQRYTPDSRFVWTLRAFPGQHFGQGPEPRYLCPRLQVFHPLLTPFVLSLPTVMSGKPNADGRRQFLLIIAL